MEDAKADSSRNTPQAVTTWDGPTTGPKAAKGKSIVIVAERPQKQRHARGGRPMASRRPPRSSAGHVARDRRRGHRIGPHGSAFSQAITLKPDGIVIVGFDPIEQRPGLQEAGKAGIAMVAWHAGRSSGRLQGTTIPVNVPANRCWRSERGRDMGVPGRRRQAGRRHLHRQQLQFRRSQIKEDAGADRTDGRYGALLSGHADCRRVEPHGAAHRLAAAALRIQMDRFAGDQRHLLRLHGSGAGGGRPAGRGQPRRRSRRATVPRRLTSVSAPVSIRPSRSPSR